jgi:hypothetical protein
MLQHSKAISEYVEREVEHRMNILNARFMSFALTQTEYTEEVKILRLWEEAQYSIAYSTMGWAT